LISALVMGKAHSDESGRSSLRILPDGSITPSTYLVSPAWRRASIRDARLDCEAFRRRIGEDIVGIALPSDCLHCSSHELCRGGALDRRVIWYGVATERDPYCPYRHGDSPVYWRSASAYSVAGGPSIHDGYLPTLIFSPALRSEG
jgi:radical SAM protein with 4Fe4S-binding SPASM domain